MTVTYRYPEVRSMAQDYAKILRGKQQEALSNLTLSLFSKLVPFFFFQETSWKLLGSLSPVKTYLRIVFK